MMKKKSIYKAPLTDIVRLSLAMSVAVKPGQERDPDDPGPGTQLTGSIQGEQTAKGVTFDDGFENMEDEDSWGIPEFTTPPSWE